MAEVKVLAGESLLIKIGDGGSPSENFVHDCLINLDRDLSLDADVTEKIVPDCDTPSNPGWKYRYKDGLMGDISGTGLLHTASLETWFNWWKTDTAKNVRAETNGVSGANGGGYIAGAFKLKSISVSGTRKDLAQVSVNLVSHGALAWTDLA